MVAFPVQVGSPPPMVTPKNYFSNSTQQKMTGPLELGPGATGAQEKALPIPLPRADAFEYTHGCVYFV